MSLTDVDARRDRWLGVEIRHLAALSAIVQEGSFRGAADSLGYVQSAISQQVAHLEELAGKRLIERSRGSAPVSLTPAGELLVDHVDAILTRFNAAQEEIAALADGRAGTLRVGAFQSVATRVFPHVIPTFRRTAPELRVVPTETQTDLPLLEMLEAGDIELAFCQTPVPDGPFESVELMRDPYVLLVATSSPLAEREEPPPLATIGAMPLIGFNLSRAQDRMVEMFRERDVEPAFVFRSDLNATVQALVAAGVGVAVVPYLSVDPLHMGTTVFELPELPAREIVLVRRRDADVTRPLELFTDVVRSTCGRLFRH